jgi:hypothetical protein
MHYAASWKVQVRFLMRSLHSFTLLNPSNRNVAPGPIQPHIETSIENLPDGKRRPEREADNLSPSVSGLSRQCGILDISQRYRPPRPVMGIALLYVDGVCFL